MSARAKRQRQLEPSIAHRKARSSLRYPSTPPPAPGHTAQAAADGQPLNWSNGGGIAPLMLRLHSQHHPFHLRGAARFPPLLAPCVEPSSAHASPTTPGSLSLLIWLQTAPLSQLELNGKLGKGLFSSCVQLGGLPRVLLQRCFAGCMFTCGCVSMLAGGISASLLQAFVLCILRMLAWWPCEAGTSAGPHSGGGMYGRDCICASHHHEAE